MKKLTDTEKLVLDTFLNEYPVNQSFEEVINMILNEDDSIIICKTFSNTNYSDLIETMDGLLHDIKKLRENE